jgi:hypothetical protein
MPEMPNRRDSAFRSLSPTESCTQKVHTTGVQWVYKFDNGWGASIITDGSGCQMGLFEVAPIDPKNGLDDMGVRGYLTAADVIDYLRDIATR